ncbi:CPBP family intramembrane glutamic endopeptidase [Neorhodopirellula pilleata]|uniref:CAAX amino terminal protease self-immunity n=1 Tax=Neorhodopirellula pilleata TaxID=2714738 RepID=A0A5C6A6V2_9BACT|nr:CPBP family intramembrane glutamic endopeptidase [Neorhodopirellula pilleata]TWT95712.1 CAAX amino terminal protease self- immunity [Neorhodopirellula pilleata]
MDDSELDEEQTPDDLFRTAVVVEAGLGLMALLLGYYLGPSARDLVPMTEHLPAIIGGIGLGIVATIPLLLLMSLLRRIKHPAIEKLDELSDHPMIGLMLKMGPWELLAISLCAGVGEELLFRGWMMPFLADVFNGYYFDEVPRLSLLATDPTVERPWWGWGGLMSEVASGSQDRVTTFDQWASWWSIRVGWPITIAWIMSSVLFGFVHPITKLYILITGLMGLYFGALLILTGNLLIPIIAHSLYDAVQLWSAAAEDRKTQIVGE